MSDWYDLYTKMLVQDKDFKLNIPLESLPGEDNIDTMMRYFRESGILTGDDPDALKIDWELAAELDENYVKFFNSCQQAEFQTAIDQLEADGLVASSVNAQGEIVYMLTDEGRAFCETEDN